MGPVACRRAPEVQTRRPGSGRLTFLYMREWRSLGSPGWHGLAIGLVAALAGCGASHGAGRTSAGGPPRPSAASRSAPTTPTNPTTTTSVHPPPPRYPVLLGAALRRIGSQFTPTV